MLTCWSVCLLWCVLASVTHCQVFETEQNKDECKGSVTLYEGSNNTVVTEDGNVSVTVDKVKLEGCGCFTIHSRKGGRGRSYFLGRAGEYTAEDIGWSKVRSVKRAECERWAMPVWAVILIVVGLVVVAGVLAVFGFKKYRQKQQSQSQVQIAKLSEIIDVD